MLVKSTPGWDRGRSYEPSLTLITLSRNPLLIPLYCRVNGGSDTPPVGEHEAEEPEDELGGATLKSWSCMEL